MTQKEIRNKCAEYHLLGIKPHIHLQEGRIDARRDNYLYKKYYEQTKCDIINGLVFTRPSFFQILWRKIFAFFQALAYFIMSFINDN